MLVLVNIPSVAQPVSPRVLPVPAGSWGVCMRTGRLHISVAEALDIQTGVHSQCQTRADCPTTPFETRRQCSATGVKHVQTAVRLIPLSTLSKTAVRSV